MVKKICLKLNSAAIKTQFDAIESTLLEYPIVKDQFAELPLTASPCGHATTIRQHSPIESGSPCKVPMMKILSGQTAANFNAAGNPSTYQNQRVPSMHNRKIQNAIQAVQKEDLMRGNDDNLRHVCFGDSKLFSHHPRRLPCYFSLLRQRKIQ